MNGPNEPTFGRYVVMERAGEGSLGEVFKARHQELGRLAAVKVLRAEVRGNPAAVSGMAAEASTLARLDHPNIVALYDFVQEPDRTWLAEQWVDGAPLDLILAKHRRLTPEQALGVLTGALSGLAYAHDHGVVHRDVAASNVLADQAGTSMLVDFGLASPVAGVAPSGGAVLGTPAYLSPEAARGEAVGKPGDVYSAAALTYQLLSGLPVFLGTPWEMVAAHRDRPAPALDGHGPRMTDLLTRSLAKDVAVRPPDARAFLVELEQAAEERYGAAWRSRAAIAGLVATTVATGAAVAGSGAATVVADGLPPAVTATAQVAVKTGRRVAPKLVVAAGATVAVAAAVVTAVVLTSSSGDGDEGGGAPPTSDTPSLSAEQLAEQQREEKAAALEAAVPEGRYWYRWENVSTRRDGSDMKPDRATGGPWTFDVSGCTAQHCDGSVEAEKSGGPALTFSWDGRSLDISRDPTVETNDKEACVDTETGEVLPIEESAARWTAKYAYPPVPLSPGPDGSLPATFSVTRVAKYTWEFFGTCEKGPQDVVQQRSTWTFSRHK
jgi:serine/threonine-protein kinase